MTFCDRKETGRDPQDGHAYPPTPSRLKKDGKTPATTGQATDKGVVSARPDLPPLKRPADESPEQSRKSQKVHHNSAPGGGKDQVKKKVPNIQTSETDLQKSIYLQAGRYLLEQFSVPAFRSHATVGLVDRDRIQFYHANHSVILVSSALSFAESEPSVGLDKFIAIVIAFGRLSLSDNGILHDLDKRKLFSDNEKLVKRKTPKGAVKIQNGKKLEFGGNEETGTFTVTLGEVISHEPSLAGRATAVLHGRSPKWRGRRLVVKISWPGSNRAAESKLLHEATSKANSTTDNEWALDHLPNVLYAQDVAFDSDSTYEKVASLFDDATFVNGGYTYERRTLRIIIQERLYPLKELKNVKDVGQVLLDVACGMLLRLLDGDRRLTLV
jgi:hypothetical protein